MAIEKLEERQYTDKEILTRLQRLHDALESEGWYVQANTAWLALKRLKELLNEKARKGGRPG